jgi:hypothetical protein
MTSSQSFAVGTPHGLIPSFDKKGFRVHNIVIAGSAQQPDGPRALLLP